MDKRENQAHRQQRPRTKVRGSEQKKTHKSARIFLGAFVTLLTGGLMLINKEVNPVEAYSDTVESIKAGIGVETCQEGPSESEKNAYIAMLQQVDYNISEAKAEAINSGLTFADATLVNQQLEMTPDPYVATEYVNNFTQENFGFEVKLDFYSEVFKSQEAVDNYLEGLHFFTRSLSMMPRELLRGLGIEDEVVQDLNDDDNLPGHYEFFFGRIEVDSDKIVQTSNFIHEALGHGLQGKACGGRAKKDSAFTSNNPAEFSYGTNNTMQSVVVSEYAGKNLIEDHAETTKNLVVGTSIYPSELVPWSQQSDAILGKTVVIMDRLDSIAPGSAAYLAEARLYFAELNYDAYNAAHN